MYYSVVGTCTTASLRIQDFHRFCLKLDNRVYYFSLDVKLTKLFPRR